MLSSVSSRNKSETLSTTGCLNGTDMFHKVKVATSTEKWPEIRTKSPGAQYYVNLTTTDAMFDT